MQKHIAVGVMCFQFTLIQIIETINYTLLTSFYEYL